ncbi:Uncharacterised protein [Mycobacteroides abscessus subsp. massiliense]|uniref:hypothetical protein n=1 Tax=Mycobacteroides abscessus TaxID=36809 RepID=UPI0009A80968|nr:hypothetical protein [Mycobacteroides abscessus]SKE69488.1 Uncharacterised protein [Mycobacteroides abscessus subsp. massiliense]SKH81368.1 Uncharacterised protein [Mycobacteroides abscessus subsp. massiliense]SKI34634.1 Uncharacterised protein [Mycobacteroides abscessus subsp. massiliense]SKJ35720.1 Uncharacterised protein [Mycobacteroides abscessus subsp. massiliense]SKK24080.1 Uncharacterised protein [Mycobacteroides abscessus subsp. massiliense]
MTESTELCDCPRTDHVGSPDGHCTLPSIRGEEPEDPTLARYSWCGCCMADCPDVHPTPTPGFGPVPGSLVIAKEHFDTLPEEKQRELREQEARGELRIAPRSEMRMPETDR